jgi:hypothetical protein
MHLSVVVDNPMLLSLSSFVLLGARVSPARLLSFVVVFSFSVWQHCELGLLDALLLVLAHGKRPLVFKLALVLFL